MILRDIRQTVRLMRAQPALTAAIVLMLALGIGATTAMFSVVQGVLLRPLPFPEPDRLIQIWGTRNDRGWSTVSLTEANFWDIRDRNHTFENVSTLHGANFSLTGFEFPNASAQAGQRRPFKSPAADPDGSSRRARTNPGAGAGSCCCRTGSGPGISAPTRTSWDAA